MRKFPNGFTCYTDYPFTELGDIAYQEAPVRHVKAVSWNGDKYVNIVIDGLEHELHEVKAGYLYSQRGRYGQVPFVNFRKVMGLPING